VSAVPSDPFGRLLLWFAAGGLLLFAILFVGPCRRTTADAAPGRLAFTGSTPKTLDWVEMCLGKDWGGRLSLRHRKAPSSERPMARLDNPVRHFVVDVIDDGAERVLRAYSRDGKPFSKREEEALAGCLTGAAFGLGFPRNSNVR
jgi:hypothetical protein